MLSARFLCLWDYWKNHKILYCIFTRQLLVQQCMLLTFFWEVCTASAREEWMNDYGYSRNDTSRGKTAVREEKLVPVQRCPLRKPQVMDLNRTQTSAATGQWRTTCHVASTCQNILILTFLWSVWAKGCSEAKHNISPTSHKNKN